jgi:shikimate kinase
MIILVFGNMGSGKTTIAKVLSEKLKFPHFNIDQYRIHFSDGTEAGEAKAKDLFVNSISGLDNVIIESLGVGILNEKLLHAFSVSPFKKLVVILQVELGVLENRIAGRDWNIPFPSRFGTPDKIIKDTNRRLFLEKSYLKWTQIANCQVKVFTNNKLTDKYLILTEILKYCHESD